MDLILLLILIALIYIAIQITRAASFLGNIESTNNINIKCMDAHEILLQELIEECEQQGLAIDEIKNMTQNK